MERMRALPILFAATAFWGVDAYGEEWQSNWPKQTERIWPGQDYYANRFLDWKITGGRLECVTGRPAKPMRTIHLLTHACREGSGDLMVSVRTGAVDPGGSPHPNTWTGFLIGVGGNHVDFRISALCHHWPSTDGGLIAAIDGTGRAVFRDNSTPGAKNPTSADEWKLIEPSRTAGPGFEARGIPRAMDLELKAVPHGGVYTLTLTATDAETGNLISRSLVEEIPAEQVSGNIALVSHTSPKRSGAGYWFRNWKAEGKKLAAYRERAFGPVLSAQYTVSGGVLKLTAQMPALGEQDTQGATLELRKEGEWVRAAEGNLQPHSFTIPFRVENWEAAESVPYRISYNLRTGPKSTRRYYYAGRIRKDPVEKKELVVAAFTGHHISAQGEGTWNHDSIWYPHNELENHVAYHRPDLLFFSGDQIYESGLSGIVREPADVACVDYLYHWVRWCWAFRDLARDTPCICLPDDHDVYHGNIWGSGGKATEGPFGKPAQDSGGYQMDPLFVNAVHRTQVSHLPDPYDARPIERDISVYYTRLEYGGVSFAIIADRMWKSSPTVMVPEGDCRNGWFEAPGFDTKKDTDVPGAVLLGNRQLRFLDRWANDWRHGAKMKVLLSQTIFSNIATLPEDAINDTVVPTMVQPSRPGEYMEHDKTVADGDSNGWPQAGRDKALRVIRKGFAFHIAGDQHLASFIRYGIDDWNDAGHALCVPSIANVWPRRWFPPQPGADREPGAPRYTGEHEDGFGNKITVYAVANPSPSGQKPAALYDRMPGYGIVRLNRTTREIVSEVWPRWVDPSEEGAQQYPGWPRSVSQFDQYGREAAAYLPTLVVEGMEDPVVQVVDEQTRRKLYTLRILGTEFQPKVFEERGAYTIRVGEPGTKRMKLLKAVTPLAPDQVKVRHVNFED